MAEKLNLNEIVSFEELIISNTIQIDAVTQLKSSLVPIILTTFDVFDE